MASLKNILTQYLKDKYNYTLTKDFVAFGIRGAKPDNDGDLIPTKQTPDIFDDAVGLLNSEELQVYLGTVDPGKTYTDNPMNPSGCFHLNNGFYVMQKAIHMGHPAFNLYGKFYGGKLEGWRDTNKNFQNDEKKIYTDATGVDCHAMNGFIKIGAGSAGCQGIAGGWNGKQWLTFQTTLYASPQKNIPYCLLDYEEIEKELDK